MATANVTGDRKDADARPISSDDDDPEKLSNTEQYADCTDASSVDTKLDSNGLPLVPQPSRWKDDPLVSFTNPHIIIIIIISHISNSNLSRIGPHG